MVFIYTLRSINVKSIIFTTKWVIEEKEKIIRYQQAVKISNYSKGENNDKGAIQYNLDSSIFEDSDQENDNCDNWIPI